MVRAFTRGLLALFSAVPYAFGEAPPPEILVDALPDEYVIAHVGELRIGPEGVSEPVRRTMKAAALLEPLCIAVSGAVTAGGSPAAFGQAKALFDTLPVPVLFSLGEDDLMRGMPATFFAAYRVNRIGSDPYDAIFRGPWTHLGGSETDRGFFAEMHALRRRWRGARWSIALTSRYEPAADLRMHLIMMADDPVDAVLASAPGERAETAEPVEEALAAPAWEGAQVWLAPPASTGFIRLITVSRRGLEATIVEAGAVLEAAAAEE